MLLLLAYHDQRSTVGHPRRVLSVLAASDRVRGRPCQVPAGEGRARQEGGRTCAAGDGTQARTGQETRARIDVSAVFVTIDMVVQLDIS